MHNMQAALIQALLTRNIQNDIANLKKFDIALTEAMTPEQRSFAQRNWQALQPFLQTEEGKIALQTFMGDWITTVTAAAQRPSASLAAPPPAAPQSPAVP